MNIRLFLGVLLVLLPGFAFAVAAGGNGGLANQSGNVDYGPCSNLGCEADCFELSGYASGGMLSKSCGNKCATTNFFEADTTPTAFLSSCMKNGTKDLECAQALAELVPTSPPDIDDVKAAFKALFVDGPCADL